VDELREVARLNLVLEFVSECAGLADDDAVARTVSKRLPWIFDFERCVLALRVGSETRWLSMRARGDALSAMGPHEAAGRGHALAEEALASGAPACEGRPMSAMAIPLGDPALPFGALCIEGGAAGYTHRDLRVLHHVGAILGAVLTRIEAQRIEARARAELAEHERAAREEAQRANAAKDDFMAMLGHELRNPLAPIIAAAHLLGRLTTGAAKEHVQIIQRQARHLDRLVEDLLDISRVTTGRVSLRLRPVDLRDVVAKAAEMARPMMERKGQSLSFDVPPEALMVEGDEARLAQVVSNLLNNACIYSPPGRRVELALRALDSSAVIEIADEGIGIAPEMLGSIFEMFVQGGRSKDRAPGGLGLGLGVARVLVELHGGRISAASEGEGRGSRFVVSLPAIDAAGAARPGAGLEARSAPAPGPARRVLLVDDNVDLADSMAVLLRASGHDVLVTYGPEEALAAAAAFRPDVAVLDLGLPMMDGYQLATELRERLAGVPLALIALSGYGQERDRERSLELGFSAHLVKPASFVELLARIEESTAR
jgi:signal transduction histidine kinase/ActR/RegA family two-component response regulator